MMRRFRRQCGHFKGDTVDKIDVAKTPDLLTRPDAEEPQPISKGGEYTPQEYQFLNKQPKKEPGMRKILWINMICWNLIAGLVLLKYIGVIGLPWWLLGLGISAGLITGAVLVWLGVCIMCIIMGILGGVHSRQQKDYLHSSDGWKEWVEHKKKRRP